MEFYLKPDVPQKIHVRGKSVPTLDNANVLFTFRNRKENIIMWILEIGSEFWLLSLMNFDDHEDGELIQLKSVEQGRKAIRQFKRMLKESATRN